MAETSKVRKSRIIVVRGGEHFDRLKRLNKEYFADNDLVEDFNLDDSLVFLSCKGEKQTAETLYWHYGVFMALAEVDDWKERNLTYYSCRHFGITKRLQSKVYPLTLAKTCGTSLKHLTETYYHADLAEQVKGATAKYIRE
jgi:integrase